MMSAQTGSGKTCAFLVSAIHNLLRDPVVLEHASPQVLVVTPTRELALQIHREALKLAYGTGLLCATV